MSKYTKISILSEVPDQLSKAEITEIVVDALTKTAVYPAGVVVGHNKHAITRTVPDRTSLNIKPRQIAKATGVVYLTWSVLSGIDKVLAKQRKVKEYSKKLEDLQAKSTWTTATQTESPKA